MTASIHLLKGNDDVLRANAVKDLVDRLVGDTDRSLVLDEFGTADYELAAMVDAAQTMPFLTDRRVVVGRYLARFSNKQALTPLLNYLADPADTTDLVLVWERSIEPGAKLAALPPVLSKAVKDAGGTVLVTEAPAKRDRDAWVEEHLANAGLRLDSSARRRVVEQLGEDGGALVELTQRLLGIYGPGATLAVSDVEPFLGDAGGVPPWELTEAIDAGNGALALEKLSRMMGGGGRHPLVIMSTLQSHFGRMVRLDGSGARSSKEAAELLGMTGPSTHAARKALDQGKRLGSARLRRAVALLAQADIDLRGAQAWPAELVVEVLVARLAALAPSDRARAGSTRR